MGSPEVPLSSSAAQELHAIKRRQAQIAQQRAELESQRQQFEGQRSISPSALHARTRSPQATLNSPPANAPTPTYSSPTAAHQSPPVAEPAAAQPSSPTRLPSPTASPPPSSQLAFPPSTHQLEDQFTVMKRRFIPGPGHSLEQVMAMAPARPAHPGGLTVGPPAPFIQSQNGLGNTPYDRAVQNLKEAEKDLQGQKLFFDVYNTCKVNISDNLPLMITLEPESNRMVVYAVLSRPTPRDPKVRLELFQAVLSADSALIGKEMAGGGIGLCPRTDALLLSSSFDVTKTSPSTLRCLIPVFTRDFNRWKGVFDRIVGVTCNSTPGGANERSFSGPPALDREPQKSTGPPAPAPAPASAPPPEPRPGKAVLGLELTDGVSIGGQFKRYTDGVVVVKSKGNAKLAGVFPNDIITRVNSCRITSREDFGRVAETFIPNQVVTLLVQRGENSLVIEVAPQEAQNGPKLRYKNTVRIDSSVGGQGDPPKNP